MGNSTEVKNLTVSIVFNLIGISGQNLEVIETYNPVVIMPTHEYDMFNRVDGVVLGSCCESMNQSIIIEVINQAICNKKDLFKFCKTELQRGYFGKWSSKMGVFTGKLDRHIKCGYMVT
ncbi:MAG: hypothetical protein QM504_08505 [Pseudomonadota bacterium]